MKCRTLSSVCPVVLSIVSWATTGCDTQPRPNSYYEEYDLFGSSNETNTDWRNHQREREAQAKWERDRTYYDFDYRQHHRDGW